MWKLGTACETSFRAATCRRSRSVRPITEAVTGWLRRSRPCLMAVTWMSSTWITESASAGVESSGSAGAAHTLMACRSMHADRKMIWIAWRIIGSFRTAKTAQTVESVGFLRFRRSAAFAFTAIVRGQRNDIPIVFATLIYEECGCRFRPRSPC